jgi:hypothetical protein
MLDGANEFEDLDPRLENELFTYLHRVASDDTVRSCDFSIGTQQAINFAKVLPMIKKALGEILDFI